MKKVLISLLTCMVLLTGCNVEQSKGEAEVKASSYQQITPEEAKSMMDKQENDILLDVRTTEEFEEGHIKGAILIPDSEIQERAEAELSDKEAVILVYCRSGKRSEQAARALSELGYTNVYDFGGILDWPYEIVRE